MKDSLMKLKPDTMEITFRRISKQNRRRLHGCILQLPGSGAAPTFYLEDLYEAYAGGTPADELAQSLIDFAKRNNLSTIPGGIDINDYECVKKHLGIMVIGADNNRSYLRNMVYEKIEDLAMIPIIFTNDHHGPGCIKIRTDFLGLWNVTEEEVLREAKENAPQLMPLTFKQLNEVIGEESSGDGEELFVISNCYYAGGAAVAFYPKVLMCIATALNKDLFILPSSINELIVVTDVGQDPETLHMIVKEVNRTQLKPQDILTDSVYYYSREGDRFRKLLPA